MTTQLDIEVDNTTGQPIGVLLVDLTAKCYLSWSATPPAWVPLPANAPLADPATIRAALVPLAEDQPVVGSALFQVPPAQAGSLFAAGNALVAYPYTLAGPARVGPAMKVAYPGPRRVEVVGSAVIHIGA